MKKVNIYTIFRNCDDSILLLNPFLRSKGYIFIKMELNEIEDKFHQLFSVPDRKMGTDTMKFGNAEVSEAFGMIIFNHSSYTDYFFGDLTEHYFAYLLTYIDQIKFTDESYYKQIMKFSYDINQFANELLCNLRLIEEGDIESTMTICVNEDNTVPHKLWKEELFKRNKVTSIKKETLDNLIELISNNAYCKLNNSDLTGLSIQTFLSAYKINDSRIRYLTLMICLESIFNVSKDQISHTISRHTAILLSDNIDDFNILYKRIKKLYGIRSTIVHGDSLRKENIQDLINEIENYVRRVFIEIVYSASNLNREQLFYHLNSKGF